MDNEKMPQWPLALAGVVVLLPVVLAWSTGWWVVTAIPVGFLFGFFLQKGDLCGSSAMSEVLSKKSACKPLMGTAARR